ncbi:MAG: putative DNA binding domain-containing protein, partial [Prevotellaceae bacterium]|nr:putative DNA binding domain-containing protein [Prevotellaceae bacterium]
MTASDIKNLILQGEGVSVEFKACTEEISPAVYETVCAFLNRSGGHILLGVNDNGEIAGIREQSVESLLKNFINTVNNPEILNPTFLFAPKIIELDGKKIIDIYVPESSEVHRYKGRIFDRAGDADNDITRRHSLIDNIYLRKRKDFSESEVLPFLEIKDLDKNTLEKARKLVAFNEPNHPWKLMNDEELLHSAGFWKKDKETGKEGFILATALLFGQENTISNYCPAYKTDAIYRNTAYRRFLNPLPEDPDRRYDDRDIIYVNLIEAYDRLMNFVKRNLPDKFYLPPSGTQRIDLRDRIFREIVANLLVHREFSNRFPAKFLVFSDRVITENWTRPAGKATATLNELETYTKNPMIAKIFRELGYVEELGSGRINIQRYAP